MTWLLLFWYSKREIQIKNAKMPACAETQVESGLYSCLKSDSDLISICRKRDKLLRFMIIHAFGFRFFPDVRGEILLISLFCPINWDLSDLRMVFRLSVLNQDENLSNSSRGWSCADFIKRGHVANEVVSSSSSWIQFDFDLSSIRSNSNKFLWNFNIHEYIATRGGDETFRRIIPGFSIRFTFVFRV